MPGSQITYQSAMSVKAYLRILERNDAIAGSIRRFGQILKEILSSPDCKNIRQIKIDLDVIEVSDGWAFQISRRRFYEYRREDFEGRSARAFVEYDARTPPQAERFAEDIINSFQPVHDRINVLNKMYQCLMAKRVPTPIKKLLFVGPQDSGIHTWLSIFRRLISRERIVTLSHAQKFKTADVREDTELIVVREASRMNRAQAEHILRGHGVEIDLEKEPWAIFASNYSPFYMTSTNPPNLGPDAMYVTVYRTRSLPDFQLDTDTWMYNHAMDCIAWIAREINDNIEVVENEERWYEDLTGINLI